MTNTGRVLEPGRDYRPTPLYKLVRARMLTDALRAEVEDYRAGLGTESVTRLENDRKAFTIYARIIEDPPLEHWGLIVGDILHNYRSALDGFTWELAKLDGGVPPNPKALYFPLYKRRDKWERARETSYSSIPAEILDRLATVQPFVTEPVERGVGLFLHHRNIDDKHRSDLSVDLKARHGVSYSLRLKFEGTSVSAGELSDGGFQWLAPDETIRDGMPIFRAESTHRVSEVAVEKLPLDLEIVSPGETDAAWHALATLDLQVSHTFEVVSQGYANDDPNVWLSSVFSEP